MYIYKYLHIYIYIICFTILFIIPCTARTFPFAAVGSNRSHRNTKMPSNLRSLLRTLWSAVWTLDLVAVSCAPQVGNNELGNQAKRKGPTTRASRSPMSIGLMKIGWIGGKARLAKTINAVSSLWISLLLTQIKIMHALSTWQGRES